MAAAPNIDPYHSDLKWKLAHNAFASREVFSANYGLPAPFDDTARAIRLATKIKAEYEEVKDAKLSGPAGGTAPRGKGGKTAPEKGSGSAQVEDETEEAKDSIDAMLKNLPKRPEALAVPISTVSANAMTAGPVTTTSLVAVESQSSATMALIGAPGAGVGVGAAGAGSRPLDAILPAAASASTTAATSTSLTLFGGDSTTRGFSTELIMRQRRAKKRQPEWHAPWKLKRVVPGHQGWVRCISVDPSNEWFATGSADKTIKIWDLASGILKLTLTGHIAPVRGVEFSARSPYLFSASEDRTVKCWDLETNRVIRDYHGHLSGVTVVKAHPELDLIVSGGRDGSVRVWDVRTRAEVRTLTGHKHTIGAIELQGCEPQIISGSFDGTVRLWDLVEGRSYITLTHHKKSVRALRIHPTENTFASGSTDAIKAWKLPEPVFMRNMNHSGAVVNSLAFNNSGVLVSGCDDGHLQLYDWKTGVCFQDIYSIPQSGSHESEAGILGMEFDVTGTRLITAETDKTIKFYIEDTNATPETHPMPKV